MKLLFLTAAFIISINMFGMDTALSILLDGQSSKGIETNSGFTFPCNNEPQEIVSAVRNFSPEIMNKIQEHIAELKQKSISFAIENGVKDPFIAECTALESIIVVAQKRVRETEKVNPLDAKRIGGRSYGLSRIFAALHFLADSRTDQEKSIANKYISSATSFYTFIVSQEANIMHHIVTKLATEEFNNTN